MPNPNDSHLPAGPCADAGNKDPLPQRHRAAQGKPVDGQKNPNGAESGSRDKRIGNAPCNY